MWAIRHKKTHEWVYGTDYRHKYKRKDKRRVCAQRTSSKAAITFEDYPSAKNEFDWRGCSPRYYEIVSVMLIVGTEYIGLLSERLLAAGKGE